MTIHEWRDAFIRYMKSGEATEREWHLVAIAFDMFPDIRGTEEQMLIDKITTLAEVPDDTT